MKLIDKDVLEAEIKRIEHETNYETFTDEVLGKRCVCRSLLSFLDTLKVKEVDLEKEIKNYLDKQPIVTRSEGIDYKLVPSPEVTAKHFFELGLKTQKGE